MTLQRMDNILIVVDDLEAAKAFFVELGMQLEGEMPVEGHWVDQVVGLENVRAEIAMLRTPDGHGRVELTKFHAPAGLCTQVLRIIRSAQTLGKMPSLHRHLKGHCHGVASFFLPVGVDRTCVALPRAPLCRAM